MSRLVDGFEVLRRRRLAGWTQHQLAARAGVNVRTITRIERNYVIPNMATLARIAQALDVTVAELVGAVESEAMLLSLRARTSQEVA